MISICWKASTGGVDVTVSVSDHSGPDKHTVHLEAGQKIRATWLNQGDKRTSTVDVECFDPADEHPLRLGFGGDVVLGAVSAGSVEVVSTSPWIEVGRIDVTADFSARASKLWRAAPGTGVRFPKVLRTPAYARALARDFVPPEGACHRSTVDRLPVAVEPPRSSERCDREVG